MKRSRKRPAFKALTLAIALEVMFRRIPGPPERGYWLVWMLEVWS